MSLKKCFRSIDPVQEPTDCIGSACMAWKETHTFTGCVFVIEAQAVALSNILELSRAPETKVVTPETEIKNES